MESVMLRMAVIFELVEEHAGGGDVGHGVQQVAQGDPQELVVPGDGLERGHDILPANFSKGFYYGITREGDVSGIGGVEVYP